MFKAIAGLWPWGSGKVALPASNGVTFVPRQPYVPLGTQRAALAYPSPEDTYKDEELVVVLRQAGLERLSSSINRDARWDKELADEEQQRLALARILLHKPRWVVIEKRSMHWTTTLGSASWASSPRACSRLRSSISAGLRPNITISDGSCIW